VFVCSCGVSQETENIDTNIESNSERRNGGCLYFVPLSSSFGPDGTPPEDRGTTLSRAAFSRPEPKAQPERKLARVFPGRLRLHGQRGGYAGLVAMADVLRFWLKHGSTAFASVPAPC
jgi:hypothetical protein